MPVNKANHGTYCDYCKSIYGKVNGSWSPRAMTPAICTIESESKRFKGRTRSYCQSHLLEITEQTSVTQAIYAMVDNLNHAKELLGV